MRDMGSIFEKSERRSVMDILKDLEKSGVLETHPVVDIKPHREDPSHDWHLDIVARMVKPDTGSTLDTFHIRRYRRVGSSLLDSSGNVVTGGFGGRSSY